MFIYLLNVSVTKKIVMKPTTQKYGSVFFCGESMEINSINVCVDCKNWKYK